MKSAFASKTNWFGFFVLLLPVMQWLLDENVFGDYPGLISLIGVVIIVLRSVTNTGVVVKKK